MQALLLGSAEGDLGYFENGVAPETYALMATNGTKIDGVFLGRGNVTTWAFRPTGGFWSVRLVGAKGLRDGEFAGFLKVVSPST